MAKNLRALTPAQAKRYYDRLGKRLDSQKFYEDLALDDLADHADFESANSVFEFGCGTGRYAARLLAERLPDTATYLGCDVSPVMIGLAAERLAAYSDRASVIRTDGIIRFPLSDRSVDRVVCTYVLDLLSEADIPSVFTEARRVLVTGGILGLVSLTCGTTFGSRIVSGLWSAVFRARPSLVGGCRPIRLEPLISPGSWDVEYENTVPAFGVRSEVLVVRRRG